MAFQKSTKNLKIINFKNLSRTFKYQKYIDTQSIYSFDENFIAI